MDRWVSESRPTTQYATSAGMLAVGGLLAFGSRGSLRSGGYPLFAPGRFFPGASDRSTVEAWRRRLLAAMGRPA